MIGFTPDPARVACFAFLAEDDVRSAFATTGAGRAEPQPRATVRIHRGDIR